MDKIKVLIVEDEAIVAYDIESALVSLGYEVTFCAINYDEAIKSVKENTPDIILMDINLENSKDGIETAKDIQKIKKIPIIYLTAFSDDKTIDRAIQTNPINYMLKPFKREELKTTIRLALYKLDQHQTIDIDEDYEILGDGYYYDMNHGKLYYDNIPIKLSTKEKSLLNILLNAKGNIVSFEDIESHVWRDKVVADSTFRALVYRLRSKMEHMFIETVAGFGCRLNTK
jgi:DNA-binding response OmpR family regulator